METFVTGGGTFVIEDTNLKCAAVFVSFYTFYFKLCSTLSALPTRRTKQRRPGSGRDQLQLPAVRLPVLNGAQRRCHRGGAAAAALPAQPLHPPMLHSALHVLSTGAVSAAEAPGGGEMSKLFECLFPLCLLGNLKKKGGGGEGLDELFLYVYMSEELTCSV